MVILSTRPPLELFTSSPTLVLHIAVMIFIQRVAQLLPQSKKHVLISGPVLCRVSVPITFLPRQDMQVGWIGLSKLSKGINGHDSQCVSLHLPDDGLKTAGNKIYILYVIFLKPGTLKYGILKILLPSMLNRAPPVLYHTMKRSPLHTPV